MVTLGEVNSANFQMHFGDTMTSFQKILCAGKYDYWAENIIHNLLSYQEFYWLWGIKWWKVNVLNLKTLQPMFKNILCNFFIKWKSIK